ncbi:glycine cleavage system protein GcvH [Rhodococcus koreensis]|uniref:Glycine cleavage system H protein n=1 Tax=Rhodococcus koreensis TaxID=99653 RepID=A0A1H4IH02_9NOCA|nr:glycine cleavage system protein GcvH [Rhodococcus koreensis]SEB33250.1 glycine cleavage system H protein [Rhodococcus koreensis]
MSEISLPGNLSYTDEHEWVAVEPGAALPADPVRVGITAVAVDNLGDLVYLELPTVGSTVTLGEACGEVESTKTVSELYPPVSGTVSIVNTAVVDDPELVSKDPYGEGWLFAVLPSEAGELLTAAEYAEKNGVDA